MSLVDFLLDQIKAVFHDKPHQFFTEHDIHSELSKSMNAFLESEGRRYATTKDGYVVNRVHHEYPTPFRCDMRGYDFKFISEEQFKEEKRRNTSFKPRRGWIDFVVFNPEYISSNSLRVVSGKDYGALRSSLNKEQPSALDVALEVVTFLIFDKKPHKGIMMRRVKSVEQDYKKICALMDFNLNHGVPFCKNSSLMFFSNTNNQDKLKAEVEKIKTYKNIPLYLICKSEFGVY